MTVVLDIELTPELIEEGFVREYISKIQNLRKDSGFEVQNHIEMYYQGSEKLEAIIEKNKAQIADETLADKIIHYAFFVYIHLHNFYMLEI